MKRLQVALAAAMLAAAPVRSPAQAPSAAQFYAAAIDAMGDLPQPRYVTYTVTGNGDGITVRIRPIDHLVWLLFEAGSDSNRWSIRHRSGDYASEVVDRDGRRYVTFRSFFDPTWYGTYRALRDGMLGTQDDANPVADPSRPVAAATPIPVIALVNVMGHTAYDVFDRGAATCPNGDPGHALHLSPKKRHDEWHQLSDVVVDVASMRFCMLRFGYGDGFGFNGTVEQHYGNVGGYWMLTDGVLDGTLRAFGISTHHGVWRYRLSDVAFPPSIPPEAFVLPDDQ